MGKIKKVIGITSAIVGAGVLALLFREKEDDGKYSDKWFSSLSDEELEDEREKTRLQYCSPEEDGNYRAWLKDRILPRFDQEIYNRQPHSDNEGTGRPAREHGYNLYKPEK